jgi:hypothetical protein
VRTGSFDRGAVRYERVNQNLCACGRHIPSNDEGSRQESENPTTATGQGSIHAHISFVTSVTFLHLMDLDAVNDTIRSQGKMFIPATRD